MHTHEPDWFAVVGGPPPTEVLIRELLLTALLLLPLVVSSLWLPMPWRLIYLALGIAGAVGTSAALRLHWRRRQQVRVLGNVLEHRDGARIVRVALNRAVLSTAAAPSGVLVLVLDDGRSQVMLARRADDHELLDLPPCLGPYLELLPDDFESVRIAAQRSYPQA